MDGSIPKRLRAGRPAPAPASLPPPPPAKRELKKQGARQRAPAIGDALTRVSTLIDPPCVYRGEDVARALDETRKSIGYPKTIRIDQGPGFISHES